MSLTSGGGCADSGRHCKGPDETLLATCNLPARALYLLVGTLCVKLDPRHVSARAMSSQELELAQSGSAATSFDVAISTISLSFTLMLVTGIAWYRVYPLLSGSNSGPIDSGIPTATIKTDGQVLRGLHFVSAKAPAITFSITIGLSAVLAELIFCEITNLLDAVTRRIALEATLSSLLVLLVLVIPTLEIHYISGVICSGLGKLSRRRKIWIWMCDGLGLLLWFSSFWFIGRLALNAHSIRELQLQHGITDGTLERIGVIGILLMAILAGFAAVSSLWQTFGVKHKIVTESDVKQKENGLRATTELLQSKQAKLQALERKMSIKPKDSFMARMIGTIRGDNEAWELSTLRLEISGLETMQMSLSASVGLLRARRDAQLRASTAFGRLCIAASYIFSIYCFYRITATSVTTLRRWWNPSTFFATSDPINNFLAIVAKHFDPTLDRAAWSRQISFLLSGLMLSASFNAVLQTVLLFSRFAPSSFLRSAHQNLALVSSQICATYVVSSALLLRSNLPKEMSSVIEGALGAPLDVTFVDKCFERWFLGACALTAVGITIGRIVIGPVDDEVQGDDIEAGKSR